MLFTRRSHSCTTARSAHTLGHSETPGRAGSSFADRMYRRRCDYYITSNVFVGCGPADTTLSQDKLKDAQKKELDEIRKEKGAQFRRFRAIRAVVDKKTATTRAKSQPIGHSIPRSTKSTTFNLGLSETGTRWSWVSPCRQAYTPTGNLFNTQRASSARNITPVEAKFI